MLERRISILRLEKKGKKMRIPTEQEREAEVCFLQVRKLGRSLKRLDNTPVSGIHHISSLVAAGMKNVTA